MKETLKDKILYVLLYFSVGILYLAFASSALIEDISNDFFLNYSTVLLLLQFIMLMIITSTLLVNVYTFLIIRRSESLVYALVCILFLVYIGLSFFSDINQMLNLSWLLEVIEFNLSNFILLLAESLLLLNLFISQDNYFNRISRAKIVSAFVLIVMVFVLLVYYNMIDSFLYIFLITVFGVANILGYLARYFLTAEAISRNIVFVFVVFLMSSAYPWNPSTTLEYHRFLRLLFWLIAVVSVANAFYKEIFYLYFVEKKQLNDERERYAIELQQEVRERTKGLEEINRLLNSEIDAAKKLQQSIFPEKKKSYGDVNFITTSYAYERLSGDFLDIYQSDDHHISLYVQDVSGHGISAALLSIYTYQYIRSLRSDQQKWLNVRPDKNLQRLYKEFNRMNFPDNMHLVIFMATYSRNSKRLRYASGGLNVSPVLVRNTGDIEHLDQSSGFPICNMGDYFQPKYESVELELFKGDRIIFFTDGLIENTKDVQLSLEDIEYMMIRNMDQPLESVDEAIRKKIEPFKDQITDDISYLIMEITE